MLNGQELSPRVGARLASCLASDGSFSNHTSPWFVIMPPKRAVPALVSQGPSQHRRQEAAEDSSSEDGDFESEQEEVGGTQGGDKSGLSETVSWRRVRAATRCYLEIVD